MVPGLLGVLLFLPAPQAWWGLAIPALAAIVAGLWPLPLGQVARAADRSAGLNGAADTALHLASTGHPAAGAVMADAVDALAGKAPPKHRAPLYWRPLLGGVLALFIGVGVRTAWPLEEADVGLLEGELDDPLAEIQERARRLGDEELVAAVQELRVRLERAQAPQAVRRHAPASEPKPPAPMAAPLPPPPPQLPADMQTPQAYQEAVDLAVSTMASDDALLAAIAEEIYEQLQDLSFSGDLGVNFLQEAMMDGDISSMAAMDMESQSGGRVRNDDPMSAFRSFGADQGTLNNQMMETSGVPQAEFDPSMVKGNDLGSEAHEAKANLMASYRDFMKEYSEALRDELIRAIEESADPDKWKAEEQPEDDAPSKPGGPKVAGGEPDGQGSTRSQAQLRPTNAEPPEGAAAMSAPVGAQGKPSGRGEGSSGGDAGAGKRVAGGGGAAGELSQVQGQLTPGALDATQRQAVLEGVAKRSVEAGPGQEFDDAWGGYFDEVDRTLEEEDMPPQMQSMVRAYFAGLQESQ